MMPKTLSILVFLCTVLISKILFSTENQIEMPFVNHDQALPLYQKKFTNLLIYPTPDSFKYFISPYLSPKAIIQTYKHFKILNQTPDLLDYCPTSTVLDLKEIKTLYFINAGNNPSPENVILYSNNSKTAIIPESISPEIRPNKICALLSSNKIFPFKQHAEVVWVARDLDNFCVSLKTNENKFTIIACGNLHEMNFEKDLASIWKAYNLKGSGKFLVATRYFLTIPFVKYFEYISPFLAKFFNPLKDWLWTALCLADTPVYLDHHGAWVADSADMYDHNVLKPILLRILWFSFCYLHAGLEFHIFVFPFHVLAYTTYTELMPTKEISYALISLMSWFFTIMFGLTIFPPNLIFYLLQKMLWSDLRGEPFVAKNSKHFLAFVIEPQNTMWALPFMIERPKTNFISTILFFGNLFFPIFFKLAINFFIVKFQQLHWP